MGVVLSPPVPRAAERLGGGSLGLDVQGHPVPFGMCPPPAVKRHLRALLPL